MELYIEKVHGLQSTSISLNDRFTVLQSSGPARVYRPRRQTHVGNLNRGLNQRNRQLVEQIARRIDYQAKLRALRHRLGIFNQGRGFYRYNQNRLPGLRRASSFGNISQGGFRKWNNNWHGSNGNLSRSASYGNLSQMGRGRARRGGGNLAIRGRFRSYQNSINRAYQQLPSVRGAQGRGRGRGRGRGQGGVLRNQNQKPVPSKEELDIQLDQYMASSKSALDQQLDAYMQTAVEMEE